MSELHIDPFSLVDTSPYLSNGIRLGGVQTHILPLPDRASAF